MLVLQDVAYSLYGSAQVDLSASGMLVYRPGGPGLGRVTLQKLDGRGGQQPLLPTPGTFLNPRVSPDGTRILLSSREMTDLDLSVYDTRRGVMNPLVQYPAGAAPTAWAPFAIWTTDGKFVVFRGEGGMFWVRSDSFEEPHPLTRSALSQTPASFSPDGKTLLYYQGTGNAGIVGASESCAVFGREQWPGVARS